LRFPRERTLTEKKKKEEKEKGRALGPIRVSTSPAVVTDHRRKERRRGGDLGRLPIQSYRRFLLLKEEEKPENERKKKSCWALGIALPLFVWRGEKGGRRKVACRTAVLAFYSLPGGCPLGRGGRGPTGGCLLSILKTLSSPFNKLCE